MIYELLIPSVVLGGVGLAFGVMLGGAGKIFAVETDERIPQIMEVLPGANCGGCGFAGCSQFANALIDGTGKVNGCPVGGKDCADKISEILGVEKIEFVPSAARVLCSGSLDKARQKYEYNGIEDCIIASKLGGGQKDCDYGCLGLGSCVRECNFGAIKIENGVAVIDQDKCTACAKCVAICPKSVIEIVPKGTDVTVMCKNKDKGPIVKDLCSVGCIGCKICEKNCEFDAIKVDNFIAKIDYDKCTSCNKCVEKCPKGSIICI